MSLRIGHRHYRLLFKHPFGTAHGSRDGTDALFIRVEEEGLAGYGEVTLPPYLDETIGQAVGRLRSIAARGFWTSASLFHALDALPEFAAGGNGCRAGLSTALIDLIGKQRQLAARELLEANEDRQPVTLMTLGICPVEEIRGKLAGLPMSGALKLKVGDPEAAIRIAALKELDDRKLFLDGNQGMRSIEAVLELSGMVGKDRLLGWEQPFPAGMDHWAAGLKQRVGTDVHADESIQGMADLESKHEAFTGVNIKLMKCGGLDRAMAMVRKARDLGLKVMLGCMSESSLGCTAMAQLSGSADVVDLDGPWLLKNDPFHGLDMKDGELVVPAGPGVGAEPILAHNSYYDNFQ